MKYKLLATLLTALLLASPVLGFWHPPVPEIPRPPCTPYFVTMINDVNPIYLYNFTEPKDGYCTNFNVTVFVKNVTDLYGYEINVQWDPTYIELLSWDVAPASSLGWLSQAIIFNGTGFQPWYVPYIYTQIVTALPMSTGVNGSFALAVLHFHINNDICWPDSFDSYFWVWGKLSDSCSKPITPCTPVQAHWKFKPVQPNVYIQPAWEINSAIGTQFTASVFIENITKMKDFSIDVRWHSYLHTLDPCPGSPPNSWYTTLLTTDNNSIVVNNALFPAANCTINAYVTSCNGTPPACGWTSFDWIGYVHVDAAFVDPLPQINATTPGEALKLFDITFTKCDPWYCGMQPEYTAKPNHDWKVENATTPLEILPYQWIDPDGTGPNPGYVTGYVSTCCPGPTQGIKTIDNVVITYKNGKYTFLPIPGDLNGDGKVNTADLLIEIMYYGLPGSGITPCTLPAWAPPMGWSAYYDLNNDGVIDIYDIVIVAKNIDRTTPSDC